MTGLIGIAVDAWDEVRVHRARVVLSLVGIVLAVFAMTATTAAGMLFKQIVMQQTEAETGRATTLTVQVSSQASNADELVPAFYDSLVKRYQVRFSSQVMSADLFLSARPDQENNWVSAQAVDPQWATIHRFRMTSGRWLSAAETDRIIPSVVVNKQLLETLGEDPERQAPFVLDLPSASAQRVVVVGVTDKGIFYPGLWVLRDNAEAVSSEFSPANSRLELWVPPDSADRLVDEINRLAKADGLDGMVQPPMGEEFNAVFLGLQALILALSLFALFLGALGVLNVGVVTVRQRVREIGIKRALGASSGRIFGAIMLESVLATVLGGLLGIALAVALVNNFPWSLMPDWARPTEGVPFPAAAAAQSFVAALAVGVLAGLVPAVIAVRAKVIDAIRY